MKHLFLVALLVWHYKVFLLAETCAEFLTTLTPAQQQAAKVTCVEQVCYIFYPVETEGKQP